MWKKSIENVKQKKGTQNLLYEALEFYRALPADVRARLPIDTGIMISDGYGRIGFESKHYILVAKAYPYGDIVSVHKSIWEKKKKIVMFIKSAGYFYGFNPAKITEITINKRGNSEMVNFSIREGVNILKLIGQEKGIMLPPARDELTAKERAEIELRDRQMKLI